MALGLRSSRIRTCRSSSRWLPAYYERIAIRQRCSSGAVRSEFEVVVARRGLLAVVAAYGESTVPFSWKKVLRHEFHPAGSLGLAFVFDAMQEALRRARMARGRALALVLRRQRGALLVFAALNAARRCSRVELWRCFHRTNHSALRDLPGWRLAHNAIVRSSLRGSPRRWPSSTGSCRIERRTIIRPCRQLSSRDVTFSTHSEGGVTAKDIAGARLRTHALKRNTAADVTAA